MDDMSKRLALVEKSDLKQSADINESNVQFQRSESMDFPLMVTAPQIVSATRQGRNGRSAQG